MGTRGYRVWRHKRRYLIEYNHSDSYPHGLGVKMWQEIPDNQDEVEQWVQKQREWVEEKIKLVEKGHCHEYWSVEDTPPSSHGADIVWLYEIDLDYYVFHVQGLPLYNLRRMPRTEQEFLVFNNEEGDVRLAYADIPKENRWDYEFERIALPVDAALLDEYATLDFSVVDDIVPPPPENETTKVRRRFAEAFISMMYKKGPFVVAAFEAHTAGDSDMLGETMCDMLDFLNRVTLRPPTVATAKDKDVSGRRAFLNRPAFRSRTSRQADVAGHYKRHLADLWKRLSEYALPKDEQSPRASWIRANVCAYFHTHLTNETNLHAGIVGLIHAITASSPKGVVYGVLNSVTHCVLLSYDGESRSVQHTLALPLLPSWDSPDDFASTPGIIALTGLCQHLDDLDGGHPNIPAPEVYRSGRLPFDVLIHVATFIQDGDTLLCFAAVSPVCKEAAKSQLMLPKLNGTLIERIYEDEEEPDPNRVRCADGEVVSLRKMWWPATWFGFSFDGTLDLFSSSHAEYRRHKYGPNH